MPWHDEFDTESQHKMAESTTNTTYVGVDSQNLFVIELQRAFRSPAALVLSPVETFERVLRLGQDGRVGLQLGIVVNCLQPRAGHLWSDGLLATPGHFTWP